MIKFTTKCGEISKIFEDDFESDMTLQLIANNTRIYEVDTKNNNKISQVDYNAILPYTTFGKEEYSRIFLHSQSGSTRLIVIYR